jgi:hypothetical protein
MEVEREEDMARQWGTRPRKREAASSGGILNVELC